LGQALADVAAIGILQERAIRRGEVLNEQLHTALNNRILIEQAKGVFAQHGHLTMDTAFDRFRGYARRHNLRLSAVAHQVIDTDLAAAVLATPATTRASAARRR
jgi:AmiR/NasT family two-component response regulator